MKLRGSISGWPDIYWSMRRLPSGLLALVLTLSCGGVTSRSGSAPSTDRAGAAGATDSSTASSSAAGGAGPATGGWGATGAGGATSRAGAESSDGATANGGATLSGADGSGGSAALAVLQSSGCGKDLPASQVSTIPGGRTGYTEFHVDQTGATLAADVPADAGERQFFVRVPADYDKAHAYRVVYLGSPCGPQHSGKTNTYPLFNEAQGGTEQVVYVGLSTPDNAASPGCHDTNSGPLSQEWEAFDLIHTFVESTYCVDNNRIYVAGYSSGGWLANMWGCYFGGTPSPPFDKPDLDAGRQARKFAPHWAIRGHLSTSGSLPGNQPVPCNGAAAGFWIHDLGDQSNLIATNIAALNLSLKSNGCTGDYANGPKQPWAPAENVPGLAGGICQQYTGCPADVMQNYPLVFCTTAGLGHGDQSASAIPAFTEFMNQLDASP